MYTVYGISNCDTIKKTIAWLQQHKIAFNFHDYKKSGITQEKLHDWCRQSGWETIFNKRSSTLKELDPKVQESVTGADAAIGLMLEHTSIIKRPVIEKNGKVIAIGFDPKKYEKVFGKKS